MINLNDLRINQSLKNKMSLYIPKEVLTFDKLNKMIILPFEYMKRLRVPFRYKNKWFRRTSKNSGYCAEIKIMVQNKNLIMLDYNTYKWNNWTTTNGETIYKEDLIAVYDIFLTNYERKFAVSTFNLENVK